MDRLQFKGVDFMSAIDPNVCSCLDWDEVVLSQWSQKHTTREFCWQHAPSPPSHAQDHHERQPYAGEYRGSRGQCKGKQHGLTAEYGTGTYDVAFFNCMDDPNMIDLRTAFTSAPLGSPSDAGWRCSLYPPAFLERDDEQMQGITWCTITTCGQSY